MRGRVAEGRGRGEAIEAQIFYNSEDARHGATPSARPLWVKVDGGTRSLFVLDANVDVAGKPSGYRDHVVSAVRLEHIKDVLAGESALFHLKHLKEFEQLIAQMPAGRVVVVEKREEEVEGDTELYTGCHEGILVFEDSQAAQTLQDAIEACVMKSVNEEGQVLENSAKAVQTYFRNRPLRQAVHSGVVQIRKIVVVDWASVLDRPHGNMDLLISSGEAGKEHRLSAPSSLDEGVIGELLARLPGTVMAPDRTLLALAVAEAAALRQWATSLVGDNFHGKLSNFLLDSGDALKAAVPQDTAFEELCTKVARVIEHPGDVFAYGPALALKQSLELEALHSTTDSATSKVPLDEAALEPLYLDAPTVQPLPEDKHEEVPREFAQGQPLLQIEQEKPENAQKDHSEQPPLRHSEEAPKEADYTPAMGPHDPPLLVLKKALASELGHDQLHPAEVLQDRERPKGTEALASEHRHDQLHPAEASQDRGRPAPPKGTEAGKTLPPWTDFSALEHMVDKADHEERWAVKEEPQSKRTCDGCHVDGCTLH